MRKPKNEAIISTGTVEDFIHRSRERAKKIGRGELLRPEVRITFEDPLEMLQALSAQRMRVIKTVRKHRADNPTVTTLASILRRDRRAVSRDVQVLESLGLLRTVTKRNPGHGTMKVVESLAEKYYLTAAI